MVASLKIIRSSGISHRRNDELHLLVVGHGKKAYCIMAERLATVKQINYDIGVEKQTCHHLYFSSKYLHNQYVCSP